MKNSINLVIRRDELEKKVAKQYRSLRILSLIVLSSVAGISVLLFVLVTASPLPGLRDREHKALSDIAQYHPKIAKLFLTNDRLQGVTAILSSRNKLDKQVSWLIQELPPEITVESYRVQSKSIELVVQSGQLDSLQKLANSFSDLSNAQSGISLASLTSVTYQADRGVYTLNVALQTL